MTARIRGAVPNVGLPNWVDVLTYAGLIIIGLAGVFYLVWGQPLGSPGSVGVAAKAAGGNKSASTAIKTVVDLYSNKQILVSFAVLCLIGIKLLDWILSQVKLAFGAFILSGALNMLYTNARVAIRYLIQPLGGDLPVSANVAGINLTQLPVVSVTTGVALVLLFVGTNLILHGNIRGRGR